ncbi:MAG: DUF3775 domain-containing protein [Alphaproteobacteria bacterium]|nr:DUF3775 domain-containing protein [Alphaproteobacteria bacterium]
MNELTIDIDFLRMLILKIRGIQVKEDVDIPEPGGNATDDEIPETLQDLPDDLSREEVVEEIEGLSEAKQAELVALMWIGRGDAEPEEWTDMLQMAVERREVPTEQYLLDHPLVAEFLAEGLDRLGYGSMLSEVDVVRSSVHR